MNEILESFIITVVLVVMIAAWLFTVVWIADNLSKVLALVLLCGPAFVFIWASIYLTRWMK